jgi:NAD(P)-dependent dehydrogenase (short-subunit alcohol dehydrogenase family)
MAVTVAVVTGAGSGMGQLAAWHLAEQGARVAALDVDEAGLATTAAQDRVTPFTVDVTDRTLVERTVKQVTANLGPVDRLRDFFAEPEKRKKAMAIPPESVVAAIEKALAKDRFLVLPHLSGKALWRVRRHTPRLLRRVLAAERFDLI